MLEVLTKHLSDKLTGCVVEQWVSSLKDEEQQAFAAVKEHNVRIKLSRLYSDLNKEYELPFKLTAFRSHMRSYCSCRS